VIGLDASYAKGDGHAFAAACAVDVETGALVAQAVATFVPPLPYVPGYLAFRELPGLVEAVRKLPRTVRRRSVLMVDGQGILHPRRCGIASMAGLELHLPAVGVAKGKLVGRVGNRRRRFGPFVGRPVSMDEEERGVELSPAQADAAGPTLYVSPGTGLTLLQAATLTARLTRLGSKGPDPIIAADRLSREVRAQSS
jgi:deoxyribonuclease V